MPQTFAFLPRKSPGDTSVGELHAVILRCVTCVSMKRLGMTAVSA